MYQRIGLMFAVCLLCPLAAAQDRQMIRVWPNEPPGGASAVGEEHNIEGTVVAGRPIIRLANVSEPTLEVFPADPSKANGTAVIVCPGGGYHILAYDLEGTEVAEWLQSLGVTALVLKYRVPRAEGETAGERPLQDMQRALRIVRSRAEELKINPQKIGVLGFSAGGHLAVMAATRWRDSTYETIDDIDAVDSRPNFLIPIYTASLADTGATPPRLRDSIRIDNQTPPTFLTITYDDADRAIGAALMMIELKRHEVPCELHVFVRGGHGYGLRKSEDAVSGWPELCERWLRAIDML